MKYVRFIVLISILSCSLSIYGQMQQGYVKTRGRIVDGLHVKGEGLLGATVKLRGRQAVVVQQQNGSFLFSRLSNGFIIDSIQKKGYQAVDMDFLSREQKYSDFPIYLIMEKPEQQITDKLYAEQKIRKALQKQLLDKENEIAALKEQNRINLDEYQQALQKLYSEQANNERLIKQMVEQYSKLDYDQLDDFYRQFATYIDKGELVNADSLLRTRGDVNQQVLMQIKKGAVIREEKEKLSKAEAVYQATNEELSKRCHGFYENFLLQHKVDSAAYYLGLRAQLDSTNIEWQNDFGEFVMEYLANYAKALDVFRRIYNLSIREYGELSEWGAISLNNIGLVYGAMGNDSLALEYYVKSLEVSRCINDGRNPDVATSLNNIGYIHYDRGNYEQALMYYEQALEIYKSLYGDNDSKVATTINNIGAVLSRQEKYGSAIEFYSKALDIYKSVYGNKHPEIATCLNNIGTVYSLRGDSAHAIDLYEQALEIYKLVYTDQHPKIAATLNNMGFVYSTHHNYEQALKFYHAALEMWKNTCGNHHPNVATNYNNIAHVYESKRDSSQALEYYNKALEIYKSIYKDKHPKIISCLNKIDSIHSTNPIRDDTPMDSVSLQTKEDKEKLGKPLEEIRYVEEKIAILRDYMGFMTNKNNDLRTKMRYKNKALSLFIGNGEAYEMNGVFKQDPSIETTVVSTNRKTIRSIKQFFHQLVNLQNTFLPEIVSVDYIIIPQNSIKRISDNKYWCEAHLFTYQCNKGQILLDVKETPIYATCSH